MTYNLSDISMVVYTDGSCLGNGRPGAVGGWGVYFGPNDNRNLAGRLHGPLQTSQRAELEAIYQALAIIRNNTHLYADRPNVVIRTDSQYSIDCVTKWSYKWEQNGWVNSMGYPVANADLIKEILDMIQKSGCQRVWFEYVRGHSNIPGNIAAHNLANAGARGVQILT